MKSKIVSNRLVKKLVGSFIAVLLLAAACYSGITIYLSNKYYNETTQRLNARVAEHLIEEKFQNAQPFQEDGSVNKALFGDIMHDMMAVNRGIEVYLLDSLGNVLYSVVLDHSRANEEVHQVSLAPVRDFIANPGSAYLLGDDPRDPSRQNIFSAASFKINGVSGYIYIILAGADFDLARASLADSYFLKLGLGATLVTLVFVTLLGTLSIWYLTKNLRELIFAADRFRQGDLKYRIHGPGKTDLGQVAETFNDMADTILADMEKIKSVDTFRKELIANVSHDLRTPLSVMHGYVETLQIKHDSLSAEEHSQYLQVIQNSTNKLSQLVTQLFELSKLEANQVEPNKEPFLLSELVNDLSTSYQVLLEKNNIALSLDVKENLPLVFGDISLVERAIQNLLDNAIKFTPDGGKITVGLRALNSTVEVAIHDNGPGIPKKEQSLIFERYRQAKTGKEKAGAGLGLAIVKKILELHNSNIQILSQPNEGTTFSFQLQTYQLA